jgi:ATP-dependent RNA helicase SUPV3L1/SUV3
MRDGTFGVTANCPPFTDELVNAVESHAFEPLEQLCWRNSDLDFGSVDTLLASLMAPPPRAGLVRGQDAVDVLTLAALGQDAEIRRLAQGRNAMRLLWDACQIPDFRKLATDHHSRLCGRVFTHLRTDGVLPVGWIAAEFDNLDKTEGEIDTLMQRLADVRVWAYITARADWMRDAAPWANRARAIEDKISDTLHQKLMARFVDKRAAHLTRRLEANETEELLSVVTARGVVLVEGHEVGRVEGFTFHPDPATHGLEKKLVLRAARRALTQEMPRRILRAETAADAAFTLSPQQRIIWEGAAIARLRKGADVLRPAVEILASEFLDGAARERLRLRLSAFVAGQVELALAPLFAAMRAPAPVLRGLLHRLGEAAGVLPAEAVPNDVKVLLKPLGIEGGRFALYLPALLKPKAAQMRALLMALWRGKHTPELPAAGLVSCPAKAEWGEEFALGMGWIAAGPVLIRLDVAEKISRELFYAVRKHPVPVPPGLASRMSLKPEHLPAALNAVGFRIIPAMALSAEAYGPPAPPMLARRRHVAPAPVAAAPVVVRPDNPFAALAGLKRA